MKSDFYSHGKLLITGEYLVIDGAKALAVPCKKGQLLQVEYQNSKELTWNSILDDGTCWFSARYSVDNFTILETSDNNKAQWLSQLLLVSRNINPDFIEQGCHVITTLEFPQLWGLGSSSTLINNVAQWADVSPFELHFSVSNGSGYDIACASNDTPLIYCIDNQHPCIEKTDFAPAFSNQLFFVYLNQKQNSFSAVQGYNQLKQGLDLKASVEAVNKITEQLVQAKNIETFESIIYNHEFLLSNILQQDTIKEQLFPMFPRAIKSLGAWGGDFILATGGNEEQQYFRERGYDTIISFEDMLL